MKRALAVTKTDVDSRPAEIVISEPQQNAISYILVRLEDVREALTKIRNYREAFYETKQAEALVELCRIFIGASHAQRMAAQTALLALHCLGKSLRDAFPGQSMAAISRHVAEATQEDPRVIKKALSISRYTLGQVSRVVDEMLSNDEMPTEAGVQQALASTYGDRTVDRALRGIASRDQALTKDIKQVTDALAVPKDNATFDAIERGMRSAEDEYKDDIKNSDDIRFANTLAMLAKRTQRRNLHKALQRNKEAFMEMYTLYKQQRETRSRMRAR